MDISGQGPSLGALTSQQTIARPLSTLSARAWCTRCAKAIQGYCTSIASITLERTADDLDDGFPSSSILHLALCRFDDEDLESVANFDMSLRRACAMASAASQEVTRSKRTGESISHDTENLFKRQLRSVGVFSLRRIGRSDVIASHDLCCHYDGPFAVEAARAHLVIEEGLDEGLRCTGRSTRLALVTVRSALLWNML